MEWYQWATLIICYLFLGCVYIGTKTWIDKEPIDFRKSFDIIAFIIVLITWIFWFILGDLVYEIIWKRCLLWIIQGFGKYY